MTEALDRSADRRQRRLGFTLAAPSYLFLLLFFLLPLLVIGLYSFSTRNRFGEAELRDWNLEGYRRLGNDIVLDIVLRSVWLAALTTAICLVLAYPFAYFMATRSTVVRNVLLVLVMIPFWSNFLVRNYAWRVILGNDGPMSKLTELVGLGESRLLFTPTAVVLGLVYGFLPFMVLPLYASIERIDHRLLEASRDLYAPGVETFRRVVWPLSMPGVIAGSILVFVPSLGAYVTPELLGGAKTTLLGSYVVTQFLEARNWPSGAAISAVVTIVMLIATMIYFRRGGRNL